MSKETPVQALNLDKNAQKAFIKYYRGLDEKPKTTIRFFNRIEYYSVHGDDADVVSKILYHSTAQVKHMNPGEVEHLPYLSISKGLFEQAARELLLVKNNRVEVYCKDKTARQSDWSLDYKGSPGNLIQFEDVLYNKNDDFTGTAMIGVILKIERNQRNIGFACLENTDCMMHVSELIDDDFYAELEATIVLLSPRECLLPSGEGDYKAVKELMERNNVLVTIRKKTEFAIPHEDIIQDLNKLLSFKKGQQESANTFPEVNRKVAMAALGAVIRYMMLLNDDSNFGQFQLKQLNLTRYVHLDAAAVRALNILPRRETNVNSNAYRWDSVQGVLDRCRTPQGHRLMGQWVKQPLRNAGLIQDRQNIVQCLLDSPSVLQDLYDIHMKRVPDVLLLAKRLMRKKATLQDLFRVYQLILRLPQIEKALSDMENVSVTNILSNPLKDVLGELNLLKDMVEQVIDIEGVQKGEYYVKASFDPELEQLKERLNKKQAKMDRLHRQVMEDLELDNIKLEYVSHLGHHFRVTLKEENVLRKRKKYSVLDVVKSGVRFVNEELKQYSADTEEIRETYEEQQKAIVNEVVRVAIGYLGPLKTLNLQLAEIDCLISFAIAARDAPVPYVRPKILPEGSGVLELRNLRHPCLELQEDVSYIGNDAYFKEGESLLHIITGPNMGGKSTFIRSVGTAVLLAHIGSFVPCDEATISMVDCILGRIGAADDSSKGLSTFMVEMVETAAILRTATDKSLVIIDELGRGTSTFDGLGLAWAVAEHLARETRCFTLFATHFHEIAELSESLPVVKSYFMDAVIEGEQFTLLYRLKPGVIGKSFGIEVAKLAEFPQNLIEMAQQIYEDLEDHSKNIAAEEDKQLIKYVEDAIEKLLDKKNKLEDKEMEDIYNDCRKKVRQSNSEYLRKLFPNFFNS